MDPRSTPSSVSGSFPTEEALDRYFAGEASAAERESVQAFLARYPGAEAQWRDPRNYMMTGGHDDQRDDPLADRLADRHGQLWNAMLENIERSTRPHSSPHQPPRLPQRSRVLPLALASTLLLLLIGFGAHVVRSRQTGVQGEHRVYQTTLAQWSTVRLPDGSTVTLGPSTTVTATPGSISVTGEAYFVVTPHTTRPFVVRTTHAVVHVLGTRFAVRQYPEESRSRVVVEEGRVALSSMRALEVSIPRTVLSAHMMAVVSDSGVSVTPVGDTRTLTGWRDRMLAFDGAPLRDVVAEIARSYNAVIRIEGKDLANERLVLEVAVHQQSLSQVLNLVGFAINAHVRRDGDAYVLVPGQNVATPKVREQQILPQPEKQYGR